MTNIIGTKLRDILRNLKSDAVPRPPRAHNTNEVFEENLDEGLESPNAQDGDIPHDQEFKKKKKKTKDRKPSKTKEDDEDIHLPEERKNSTNTVNTQATGDVYNIVGCNDMQIGNKYYVGYKKMGKNQTSSDEDEEEECVQMSKPIAKLMDSEVLINPDRHQEYLDHVAKNLGKKWMNVFVKFGYTKKRLETYKANHKKDVSEARYQVLLDWVRNTEDATLGHLATLLWNTGEQNVVSHLATIYHQGGR